MYLTVVSICQQFTEPVLIFGMIGHVVRQSVQEPPVTPFYLAILLRVVSSGIQVGSSYELVYVRKQPSCHFLPSSDRNTHGSVLGPLVRAEGTCDILWLGLVPLALPLLVS